MYEIISFNRKYEKERQGNKENRDGKYLPKSLFASRALVAAMALKTSLISHQFSKILLPQTNTNTLFKMIIYVSKKLCLFVCHCVCLLVCPQIFDHVRYT